MSNPSPSSLPLTATPMSNPSSSPSLPPNPLAVASSFLQHHLSSLTLRFAAPRPALAAQPSPSRSLSLSLVLAPDKVARALTDRSIFTVYNSSNEFVLVSDPTTRIRSLGLLCFRSEDADSLLSLCSRDGGLAVDTVPFLGRGYYGQYGRRVEDSELGRCWRMDATPSPPPSYHEYAQAQYCTSSFFPSGCSGYGSREHEDAEARWRQQQQYCLSFGADLSLEKPDSAVASIEKPMWHFFVDD